MAALMGTGNLARLLEGAAASARFAWIKGGELSIGSDPSAPEFIVDFAKETLVPIGRAVATSEPPEPTILPNHAGRRTGRFRAAVEDRMIVAQSAKTLLIGTLAHIEMIRPGTLEKLASEKGRTKRIVSRNRDDLYEDPGLRNLSELIDGGWWVATNNSFEEIAKFIGRAAFHAGLTVKVGRDT